MSRHGKSMFMHVLADALVATGQKVVYAEPDKPPLVLTKPQPTKNQLKAQRRKERK